jgi:hypothetical protein
MNRLTYNEVKLLDKEPIPFEGLNDPNYFTKQAVIANTEMISWLEIEVAKLEEYKKHLRRLKIEKEILEKALIELTQLR